MSMMRYALLSAVLLVGQGVEAAAADSAAQAKLAACRKAAMADDASTSFKCDWKAVVAGAPGAALTGRFRIVEKGLSGEMTILEGGDPVLVAISTATKDRNAHTCALDLRGSRDGDQLVLKEASEDECVVRIKSSKKPNVVQVESTEACRNFCGMRGGFEGLYRLNR